MNNFINRRWIIIDSTDVDKINFNQVLQGSSDSLRYSVDGTKTFVKYDIVEILEDIIKTNINPESGEEETITIPAGIYGRPDIYKEGIVEYTHDEILEILRTEEWTTVTIP